jgi:nucleoside-diphosphate-sugar epimerase
VTPRVAIAGASGVIGCAAVEAFAAAGFDVLAISRRVPVVAEGTAFTHVSVDLTDTAACVQMCRGQGPVTHLVYAAASEQAGLVAGWSDTAQIARNSAMFTNLAAPLADAGALSWVGLFQGTKAYGAHLHPITLPAREDAPRDDHANFYFEQEDALRALAARHGFDWTILRPQIVFGSAPGAAMNPVAAIGAYAALCKELGQPFAYPASGPLVWEAADAGLIAEALLWATSEDSARNATFNLTNGDIFVLHDDWPALASALGLAAADPRPGGIAAFSESDEARSTWRGIAEREGLREQDLATVIGQSHHYVDLLLSERMIAKRALPTLVSTIKIRTAGFGACRDSLASLLDGLRRMQALRLLPPFQE